MPNYRRFLQKGGIVFLTIVTHKRRKLFADPQNVQRLRKAIATVKSEMPFEILGAVVLPDHLHFLWQLPSEDNNYSKRVGKIKVAFTKSFRQENTVTEERSLSRQKHRESNIWQRRFWEHTIKDESDFAQHLDYIHYNPVKHGLVSCPNLWKYSSFNLWVKKDVYSADWCCVCNGKKTNIPSFEKIIHHLGE